MKRKLRMLSYSELTRVKVSQIEDDVLGVDDVEGGQQVRCVDAEQAVHQLQRLFAVVPEGSDIRSCTYVGIVAILVLVVGVGVDIGEHQLHEQVQCLHHWVIGLFIPFLQFLADVLPR